MTKKLNSLRQYYEGFKIKRGDKIITLSQSEMKEFEALFEARSVLEDLICTCLMYRYSDEKSEKIFKYLVDDEIRLNNFLYDVLHDAALDAIDKNDSPTAQNINYWFENLENEMNKQEEDECKND